MKYKSLGFFGNSGRGTLYISFLDKNEDLVEKHDISHIKEKQAFVNFVYENHTKHGVTEEQYNTIMDRIINDVGNIPTSSTCTKKPL